VASSSIERLLLPPYALKIRKFKKQPYRMGKSSESDFLSELDAEPNYAFCPSQSPPLQHKWFLNPHQFKTT
jgi:hypothetical protein